MSSQFSADRPDAWATVADDLRERACSWFCDQLEREPHDRQAELARQLYARSRDGAWAVLPGPGVTLPAGTSHDPASGADALWQHAVLPRCEALWRDLREQTVDRI